MHHDEESPISKLLQMRRQQQPPPEYFENFLREFQQRQRAELLRRPAWRIALERLSTRFSESYQAIFGPFSFGHLTYAGASTAVLLIAGVFTFNMLQHPGGAPGGMTAHAPAAYPEFQIPHHLQPPQAVSRHSAPVSFRGDTMMTARQEFDLLDNPISRVQPVFELTPEQVLALQEARREASQPAPTRQHPHYILDARPATYEQPVSF